ncbi:IS4 family transposase [Thiomonas delicata]|uniref:Transposase n=1 Tax=Thiomonas delicata TaxID=364030 RepID=A0A238D0J1_THIDL|nr:IS4 family transposase [Thiomonas delicata]SBP86584.1 transposase [Thiomonas delicata]SBP86771.1 transposase [Thiomonas delicata]SBP87081.1 transposase [Thiomonas delicata]SBP87147.1 transposase [Thiomonas delicata]SBP87286.1 transposase [Thiomonas delicata]
MARTRKALPAQVDVAHLISAGVLASVCPRALIEEVLSETGRASQRERLLPAPAVVYYVMALALWREAPLEEVLRVVCEGLQWLGDSRAGAVQASKSAISQARTRLGAEVMHQLADRVLRPLAAPGAPGAWYRGLRVMALDGSGMDVADEAANASYFGYPSATRGQSAFPQARLLGLVECGTHAVVAADIGPYSQSERVMASRLLPQKLTANMLVLADRGFYGFKLWQIACATGAKLAWRVPSTSKLPIEKALPDGSYLSTVFDSDDRRSERVGQTIRIVEYLLTNSATPTQDSYRLVTNILDPEDAPALELAALYHERWEVESVFAEFKTHLRANSTVLRSKTPELVRQELWGLLLAHFAIRQIMAQAAWPRGLDPDRLSFTHAVRVIKRKMPQAAAIPP